MKTIAWDIDDVLNELTRVWFERVWRPKHPGGLKDYAQLTQNPPHQILGVEKSQYLASLDEFRLSDAYFDMPPARGVVDWFNRYGPNYRHIVLTATPHLSADRAAAWVMRHFGRWVRVFAFVPSPRPGDNMVPYDAHKADFLEWFGKVDILIDDSPKHIEGARGLAVDGLLVPQPWNNATGSLVDLLEQLPSRGSLTS